MDLGVLCTDFIWCGPCKYILMFYLRMRRVGLSPQNSCDVLAAPRGALASAYSLMKDTCRTLQSWSLLCSGYRGEQWKVLYLFLFFIFSFHYIP